MKILSIEDIREADKVTVKKQKISSAELMERAALRCSEWIAARFARTTRICVLSGPGNNGGDGAAIARILHQEGYHCELVLISTSSNLSHDLNLNIERLPEGVVYRQNKWDDALAACDLILDCIFGTGVSRKIDGLFKEVIEAANGSGKFILSIDIPSGLPAYPQKPEKDDTIIQATHTLSFQCPKLAFLFPSSYKFCGEFTIIDIGLDREFLNSCGSNNFFTTADDVRSVIPVRKKFSHKGDHGHALLIAGSFGKAGAAVLAANAAIHTGCGLLTVASPECNHVILQTAVPESMYLRSGNVAVDELPELSAYDAIAVGPGLTASQSATLLMKKLIQDTQVPLVLDADAINILAENKTWLAFLPSLSILTPHPKEFERIAGKADDDFQRYEMAKELAQKNNLIVVLKGAHTAICCPDGKVYFNSSGNPGLAKGGSGDALTGMILSLLAQGLPPVNAAVAGVYLHGLAADLALEGSAEASLTPGEVIRSIGKAFTSLKS